MAKNNDEIKGLNYQSIKDNPANEQISQLNSRRKNQVVKKVTAKKGGVDMTLNRNKKAPKKSKADKKLENYLLLVNDQITAGVGEVFGPAEAKLLDYINYQANKTQSAVKDGKLVFSIEEYAKDNGLKYSKGNEQYPKRKLRKLLYNLTNFQVSYGGGTPDNKYKYPVATTIPISEYDTGLHGKVEVGFSPSYRQLITKRAFYTPIPMELFQLDPKRQAPAYAIGRYLYHNKRANYGNEKHGYGNRVKIETLLNHCNGAFPDIYKTRRFSERVYELFMKAVGEDLVEFFTIKFLDSKGKPTLLTNPSRDKFLNSTLIITDWHGYPNDTLVATMNRKKKAVANNKRRKSLKNKEK